MTTIDRHSAVGNTPNPQPLSGAAGVKAAQAGAPGAPGVDADALAYLKKEGNAPAPAFAGPARADHEQHGKAALQVMHDNVRADLDELSSSWQGAGFSDPTGAGVGINYSELIEVLVKLDSEQAKASREAHTWEYKQIAATEMQAAADARKAGQLEFVGAMVSSSMTMAAGAAQVTGGAYAAGAEGGGGGAATETAGEGSAVEAQAPAVEEGEAPVTVNEGLEGGGEAATTTDSAAGSEEAGIEDTMAAQDEVEEAAADAQSGAAVEGEDEVAVEEDAGKRSGQKDRQLFDDDTQKMMRQFSKDARAQVSAQSSQVKLSISGGIAQGLQGVGTAAKGVADLGASEYKAKEKEEQATAAEQQAVAQRELDYGKSAQENARKMMDVYDAIAQSRNASMERVLSA